MFIWTFIISLIFTFLYFIPASVNNPSLQRIIYLPSNEIVKCTDNKKVIHTACFVTIVLDDKGVALIIKSRKGTQWGSVYNISAYCLAPWIWATVICSKVRWHLSKTHVWNAHKAFWNDATGKRRRSDDNSEVVTERRADFLPNIQALAKLRGMRLKHFGTMP